MWFNSLDYAFFLPATLLLYWVASRLAIEFRWGHHPQNLVLLGASYYFYAQWDVRFLSLIVASSLVDFAVGQRLGLSNNVKERRTLLATSVLVNLGILGFFKYFNFFTENLEEAFQIFGSSISPHTLSIVLPIGISFYTFQTLSYTIDVYRREIEPTRDLIGFFTFVAFFPQLVAGPIERARSLLPQFTKPKVLSLDGISSGLPQILWGLFKKIVVADQCASAVNEIFSNHQSHGTLTLALGAVYFAFQIYCDFSGYSDIAIGTARIFGVELMTNFRYPYFSQNITEFWRRWHISLSTWFRDYVYFPLGGSRNGRANSIRNIMIVFTVSGLWHGASWTFVIWGGINGLLFVPMFLKNRKNATDKRHPAFQAICKLSKVLLTFATVCVGWVFFRAENLTHAWEYFWTMFTNVSFNVPEPLLWYLVPIGALLVIEWHCRHADYPKVSADLPLPIKWGLYYAMVVSIFLNIETATTEFIYFQF